MIQWLTAIPAERLLLWVFAAGVAWAQLREARKSLKDHGRRLGALNGRVTALETQAGISNSRAGSDGG